MRYLLDRGNTLIIRGPASFRLVNGKASILGAPLGTRSSSIVRRERQIPIEAITETDFEIAIGEQGDLFEVQGSTIPPSWKSASEALADMHHGKALIIGGTDVGKSTLSAYLTNRLLIENIAVRVVDGDVGQSDLGPPTTIGLATPTRFLSSLVDLKPDALVFIGHITPSPVEAKLIAGIRTLVDLDSNSLTIINTDGWVLEPEAILYKAKVIETIKPDIVLAISLGNELQPILSSSRARSLRVEAPENILVRSRSDRRLIRTEGYRRFLSGGKMRTCSLHQISFKLPDRTWATSPATDTDLRNLILGMLDERGFLVQIGILLKLMKDSVQLYSASVSGVRTIEVGHVGLSTDGVELGYLDL